LPTLIWPYPFSGLGSFVFGTLWASKFKPEYVYNSFRGSIFGPSTQPKQQLSQPTQPAYQQWARATQHRELSLTAMMKAQVMRHASSHPSCAAKETIHLLRSGGQWLSFYYIK